MIPPHIRAARCAVSASGCTILAAVVPSPAWPLTTAAAVLFAAAAVLVWAATGDDEDETGWYE